MTITADKKHAAVCGLFCPACSAFIGTREDPERLKVMAKRMGRSVEDLQCHGCRTETRSFYCRTLCTMAACAAEKGVDFCGRCPDYPCTALKKFQTEAPHRIELWSSQARIREAGYETWFAEMVKHYSCPSCGALNSAYDLKCRKCGSEPSCEYVRLHKNEIMKHLEKRK